MGGLFKMFGNQGYVDKDSKSKWVEYNNPSFECPKCKEFTLMRSFKYCPQCGLNILWDWRRLSDGLNPTAIEK